MSGRQHVGPSCRWLGGPEWRSLSVHQITSILTATKRRGRTCASTLWIRLTSVTWPVRPASSSILEPRGCPADEIDRVTIPRLQSCVDELRAAGNPITLRPEINGKAAMLGSLSGVLEMAKAIPCSVPCIDFIHLHARLGDGAITTYDEWISALEFYRK